LSSEAERLPDALNVCRSGYDHEQWLEADGYNVMAGPIDPWRGEAIITSEGDFQLTFHSTIPGNQDMRFAIVVDPTFQPQRCVQDASGTSVPEDIDGDWIANWSGDVDAGRLFYLNSGAYQFDPEADPNDANASQTWSLPQEWRAGYSAARFGPEDFAFRRPQYALPEFYSAFAEEDAVAIGLGEIFYSDLAAGQDGTAAAHQRLIGDVQNVAAQIETELESVGSQMTVKVHGNEWRTSDGRRPGLDGWVGLQYSWIRFDDSSDLAVGGAASGDFQIMYDATDSQSRMFLSGSFTVDKIKRDRWVTDDIAGIKAEEAGSHLCVAH